MKVICEEREKEGLAAFLGRDVAIYCMNYIYAGKMVGLNETTVKLAEAHIVFESGAFHEPGWKDAQALPGEYHYVQVASIESFGNVK
jgi:hypothetical protein